MLVVRWLVPVGHQVVAVQRRWYASSRPVRQAPVSSSTVVRASPRQRVAGRLLLAWRHLLLLLRAPARAVLLGVYVATFAGGPAAGALLASAAASGLADVVCARRAVLLA